MNNLDIKPTTLKPIEINSTENNTNGKYKNVLNFMDLILSNIGFIIGAGIFVLIGKTINITGNTAWISVILSGLLIYFISKSYVRVHNKYLSNDAEYLAINEKYGKVISNVSVILTLIGNIAIVYVVVLGFGSYFNSISNNAVSPMISSIIGLLLSTLINIYGIKLTANVNNFFTISGIIGLLFIIYLGIVHIFSNWKALSSNFKINLKDISIINILYGAFIFIFAYFGFELIIRLNAESTNNEKDIPEAINYSIWISIIIYTLVALVIIGIFGNNLDNTIKPLSVLINKLTKNKLIIKYIEFCGVGLTWNTILLSITYGSRLLTEFTKKITNKEQPKENNNSGIENIIGSLKNINNYTNTPINSIIFISVIVLILILLKFNIDLGTIIANSSLLLIMLLVYLSS